MTTYETIFDYITAQENAMDSPIQVIDGWEFNFKRHVRLSTLYKHSQFSEGNSESDRDHKPFRNIVKPILNLQYRAEDIDVKDIHIYVDDPEKFHLSFLIKKYYEDVFIVEHDLDAYFDKLKESKIDYGGGLSKKLPNQETPEVVPLQSIAFCDQSNLLGGPIGIKHFMSPNELRDMKRKGWDADAIEEAILMSEDAKKEDQSRSTSVHTPGKYIEVYEVHGVLPLKFLKDTDSEEWTGQMHIATFYIEKKKKQWLSLFKGKERTSPFKFTERDPIYGRAIGTGGVEELFDAQVWTNYDEIRMKGLLDAAAKIILQTSDAAYAARNKISDMENLEITVTEEGKTLSQVPTAAPANLALFERSAREWRDHAQNIGVATDPLLGKQPPAGTPFRLQERVVFEGKGTHEYRRGKFAKHIEEIHRDWIIPHIAKEILEGGTFLSELTMEEMQIVAERVSQNEVNRIVKEKILNGEVVLPDETEALKARIRDEFMKGGNRRFIEILKGEMKDVSLKVKINVAGKQRDLVGMVDKLVNIFRQVFAAPQVLQNPYMAKIFNQILEGSGFSPIDFGAGSPMRISSPQQGTEPITQMAKAPALA